MNEEFIEPQNSNTESSNDIAYDDERIVWSGSPSQWVNFGQYFFWSIVLMALLFVNIVWKQTVLENYSLSTQSIFSALIWGGVIFGFLNMLISYLYVKSEKTTITYNKIKESKGVTSIFRKELFCELSDISDIKSPPAGIMGVFGLSTLLIETRDNDQPIIKIRAIKDRDVLIEKLLPIWRNIKIQRKGYFND